MWPAAASCSRSCPGVALGRFQESPLLALRALLSLQPLQTFGWRNRRNGGAKTDQSPGVALWLPWSCPGVVILSRGRGPSSVSRTGGSGGGRAPCESPGRFGGSGRPVSCRGGARPHVSRRGGSRGRDPSLVSCTGGLGGSEAPLCVALDVWGGIPMLVTGEVRGSGTPCESQPGEVQGSVPL